MIWFLLFRVYGTHHTNIGYLSIPCAKYHSATSTGYDSFKYASRSQVVVPYFHCTHSFQLIVVFSMCYCPFQLVYILATFTSRPSDFSQLMTLSKGPDFLLHHIGCTYFQLSRWQCIQRLLRWIIKFHTYECQVLNSGFKLHGEIPLDISSFRELLMSSFPPVKIPGRVLQNIHPFPLEGLPRRLYPLIVSLLYEYHPSMGQILGSQLNFPLCPRFLSQVQTLLGWSCQNSLVMWPHPVHPPFMELTACSSISGLYVYLLWVFLLSWPDQCLYLVTITFQLLAFHLGKEIPHHGTCTICIIQAYRFGRCRKSHLRQWFQEFLHAISRFCVLWSTNHQRLFKAVVT